jgi:S1-C subfamily serine protease
VSLPRATDINIQGQVTAVPRTKNVLYRDEVELAVKAGLGMFLQSIDLRARLRKDDVGRDVFTGFEITGMRPAEAWFSFDLAPGDVVTHVNGAFVEHYNDWIPIFESLPERDKIEIKLLRNGEPATVTVRIEARPAAGAAPARPAAGAAPARPATGTVTSGPVSK